MEPNVRFAANTETVKASKLIELRVMLYHVFADFLDLPVMDTLDLLGCEQIAGSILPGTSDGVEVCIICNPRLTDDERETLFDELSHAAAEWLSYTLDYKGEELATKPVVITEGFPLCGETWVFKPNHLGKWPAAPLESPRPDYFIDANEA